MLINCEFNKTIFNIKVTLSKIEKTICFFINNVDRLYGIWAINYYLF